LTSNLHFAESCCMKSLKAEKYKKCTLRAAHHAIH
jgi:hypothetical protein